MSNAASAAVREIADVLPGFVLTKPPLPLLSTVQDELNRRFKLRYIDLRVSAKAMTFDEADAKAEAVLRDTKPFVPYSEDFDRALLTDRSLTGLLLMICLRREHRTITLGQAEQLLIDHEAIYFEIRSAVLDLFGYGGASKNADAAAPASPAAAA